MEDQEANAAMDRAKELAEVAMKISAILEGLNYHERLGISGSVLMQTIIEHHEYEVEVYADMAQAFANMMTSYQFLNSLAPDDDEDDDEEADQPHIRSKQ